MSYLLDIFFAIPIPSSTTLKMKPLEGLSKEILISPLVSVYFIELLIKLVKIQIMSSLLAVKLPLILFQRPLFFKYRNYFINYLF